VNYCKWKGYEDRQEEQAAIHRRASWLIHCSIVQKPESLINFWPLPSDKKVVKDTVFMSKEMWQQIKKARNLK